MSREVIMGLAIGSRLPMDSHVALIRPQGGRMVL